MMAFLRRTCREVAALLLAREDGAIQIADRVAMELHLLACEACPDFQRQLLTMRLAMKHWRNYANEDSDPGAAE